MIVFFAILPNSASASDGRINVGIVIDEGRRGNTQHAELITNILSDALIGTSNISLVERRRLDSAVVGELRRRGNNVMNLETMAEAGRVAGLQYIITGHYSRLSINENTIPFYFDPRPPREILRRPLSGARRRDRNRDTMELSVVYEINLRIINVETGEVRFSRSENELANSRTPRNNYNRRQEEESLRRRAIMGTTHRLGGIIRNQLAMMAASAR